MYIKCSKIVFPADMNVVFADILHDTKLSDRECELIGNTDVDTDSEDTLLGLVEDQVRNLLENRHTYNGILTCDDLQIRYVEWCKAHSNRTDNIENLWEWIEYEIDAKGIQVIQHPYPN
jgi:hypothetical protein